jgi:hypothetical protein
MDRGTYLPLPVSVKKVSKEPAPSAAFESGSKRPSALSPCSRRYLEKFEYQRRADEKAVKNKEYTQFPCTVAKLGASLADVKMANLHEDTHQPLLH